MKPLKSRLEKICKKEKRHDKALSENFFTKSAARLSTAEELPDALQGGLATILTSKIQSTAFVHLICIEINQKYKILTN